MQSSNFSAHLKQAPPAPVYLFAGEGDLLMDEAWNALLESIVPEKARHFNGERWAAKEHTASEVIERLSTISMFGTRQLLMVRNVDSWPKDQRDLFMTYLSHPQPTSCLVMVVSQKKGLDKLINAVSAVGVVVHFPALTGKDAPKWLLERSKRHGKQMSTQAASMLIELVGPDQSLIEREIEKLVCFVGDRAKIGPEDVRHCVSFQKTFSVFELLSYIGRKQGERAVASLRNLLLSGEPALGILALLARQIRIVWQIRDGIDRGVPAGQISHDLGLYSSRFKDYLDQASSFSEVELDGIHKAIRQADIDIKTTGITPQACLERLVTGLCMKKQKSPQESTTSRRLG